MSNIRGFLSKSSRASLHFLSSTTPITITNMLNKKLQTDHQNEMCYQLLKLMIQKMNIKFRGGLLGLKRLHGFLEVTAAQVALQAPPSPDYIPGPEEPQSPPLPNFVPGPVYPEFILPDDEILPAKEQPLPTVASPTDPEEDLKDDDDEDPKEDPVDYPTDGGDDGDDEDEPSDDDEDKEVDIKANDEEEEEHPAPADSTAVALPSTDQAPSAEETEPFETDESTTTPPSHPAYRVTATISIPAPVPTPVWSDAETRCTITRDTTFASTPTDRRVDRLEVTLPPRKRLGIALSPGYKVGESSSAAAARPAGGLREDYGFVATMDREIRCNLERHVGYGIIDSWDKIVETMQGAPASANTELGRHMTDFETRVKQTR
ncbi:hypothetical protein Tco_1111866 [Tanacetum coccineum]|uniref:Uncharacterized protein n=1 Tax=Tanacetum coccineum TaxID=301880 RepID=A0ABQ5IQH6_9ASTR